MTSLEQRLENIETMLALLVERQPVKDWYSIEEFSRIVKRSELTCRQWCRLGRIHARKQESGRGAHNCWVIAHEEMQRYQREGLLPFRPPLAAEVDVTRQSGSNGDSPLCESKLAEK